MTTVTADIWMRPDVAKTVDVMRGSSSSDLYAFSIGMIEGVHADNYWTPEQKCERTVAVLAAANAVRTELLEARP